MTGAAVESIGDDADELGLAVTMQQIRTFDSGGPARAGTQPPFSRVDLFDRNRGTGDLRNQLGAHAVLMLCSFRVTRTAGE